LTLENWRDRSLRGEVCGVVGCQNFPANQCPTCHLHYCYQDAKNHFHKMSDQDAKDQEKEDESLR
jgi:hypothetical protein